MNSTDEPCEDEAHIQNHHHSEPIGDHMSGVVLPKRVRDSERRTECLANEVIQSKEETTRITNEKIAS